MSTKSKQSLFGMIHTILVKNDFIYDEQTLTFCNEDVQNDTRLVLSYNEKENSWSISYDDGSDPYGSFDTPTTDGIKPSDILKMIDIYSRLTELV